MFTGGRMLTTLLTLIVAGGMVYLLVDGTKAASSWYAGADKWTRIAMLWVLSGVAAMAIRGFDAPDDLGEWAGFALWMLVIGLLAQGWFRQKHPTALTAIGEPKRTRRKRPTPADIAGPRPVVTQHLGAIPSGTDKR